MNKSNFIFSLGLLSCMILTFTACRSTDTLSAVVPESKQNTIPIKKSSGGSSGMEQISDSSYLIVYDLKSYKDGVRLGELILTEEDIDAYPISIDSWDAEGIASDLESICAVPGRTNEFLVAESGNWQGKIGRVFHIQVDLDTHKGKVLSSFKYPLLDLNDFDAEGDQYEAIHCLAYSEKERVLILGERGGSEVNPEGILRWGIWNIEEQTFTMDDKGLKGVKVNAPGNWTNDATKRSITDLHVDVKGIIWASASEDQGDAGPFYSVIYKLGKVNLQDTQNPISVFDNLSIGKEIHGFKIEALSGAPKDVDCTHTFGTEDEIYGGVLRPVIIGR